MAQGDHSFQLISGDGTFNARGLDDFSQKMKLSQHRVSYAIVSIIGPQSGGKSTLLNHLFRTKFTTMDAKVGRSQTTRGIWLAKATDIDPCTLIMDVEGNDSAEKEEDVTFEKQSALFALAMSDVLLINLWCNDIGREQAGCRTLLKTVFQVMMRLFSPRRRTLLFVIRDKTPVTPLECLKKQLLESIQKIYDSVSRPEAHKEAKLNNFFDVEVTSLPSYLFEKDAFNEEVDSLRQLIIRFTTNGLAGDQQGKIPASGISSNAHAIWKKIKKNKDLDLPKLKIMVSSVRCDEILKEKFEDFVKSEDLRTMENARPSDCVVHFGKKMTSAIDTCLSKYKEETLSFDESVQSAKHQSLQDQLLQHVQPIYQSMLAHLHAEALRGFQKALTEALDNKVSFTDVARNWFDYFMTVFDEGCKDVAIEQATWDSSSVRDKLKTDINAHIAVVNAQVVSSQAAAAVAAANAKAAAAAKAQAAADAQAAANAQAAAQAAAAAAAQAAAAQGRRRNLLAVPLQVIQILTGLAGLGFNIYNQ